MHVIDQAIGKSFSAFNADCVPFTAGLPDGSVDFSVYSPPFSSLYIYSESVADMGNCASDTEFFEQYRFLVREKFRVTRPGRMTAIHVKDLVYYQNSSERGTSGLRPFSDQCTQVHLEEGWDFYSRVTIWRDPVREMQKTKAHGLLWKTLRADSTFSRMGLPEYLLIFRKWAKEGEETAPVTHTKQSFPVEQWQDYASPVWNYPVVNLPETDVLNVKVARSDKDEKHLCPMPLNITRRALRMWSNPGDVVFSPFMGIGSEGVVSMEEGRKFIGCELNPIYYRQAARNIADAESSSSFGSLFTSMETEQSGESEAGEISIASASAPMPPALLAPGDPASDEGASGDVRGHAPPAFNSFLDRARQRPLSETCGGVDGHAEGGQSGRKVRTVDPFDSETPNKGVGIEPGPQEAIDDDNAGRRQALTAIAAGETVDSSIIRDLIGEGLLHATPTRLIITEEGETFLQSSSSGGTGANVRLSVKDFTADVPKGSAEVGTERLACASLLKGHSAGVASGPLEDGGPGPEMAPLGLDAGATTPGREPIKFSPMGRLETSTAQPDSGAVLDSDHGARPTASPGGRASIAFDDYPDIPEFLRRQPNAAA